MTVKLLITVLYTPRALQTPKRGERRCIYTDLCTGCPDKIGEIKILGKKKLFSHVIAIDYCLRANPYKERIAHQEARGIV